VNDYALVLNAGSSSLKFCVFDTARRRTLAFGEARGQIEGHRHGATAHGQRRKTAKPGLTTKLTGVSDVREALNTLAGWLKSKYGGSRVLGVGHRVVHGGAKFAEPVVITEEVLAHLRELIPLAPLHQPYNLARDLRL
jgi:acetate kinase